MSYLQRGNKHREIYQKNLSLIKHRWAAVGTKLDPAQLLESVKLVTNTPYPIRCIKAIHLTSAYNRNLEAERRAGLVPLQSHLAWI